MASPTPNFVVDGFSKTNRWLMYTSLMFTPAQYLAGMESHSPVNLGFLAYNWYQQYLWYTAARTKQLHALSILPTYLNLIYAITYIGGISAANIYVGTLAGIGSAGLIVLNTVTAWISLKTNLPEGDGIYQFFFFGWRRLNKGWRTFFLLWEISDTLLAVSMAIYYIVEGITIPGEKKRKEEEQEARLYTDTAIFWGSALVMITIGWPLILWTELLVSRNNIVSETDMIAVYLFLAQVGMMLLPIMFNLAKFSLKHMKMERLLTRITNRHPSTSNVTELA